ncbi:hypothetical protein DRO66_02420 [Candidatus Bathyarchaeota archaeon]|nr:MAG: hypothetical protein DRO66_02420 [Candidatus Bathyarchaeota archaeon]
MSLVRRQVYWLEELKKVKLPVWDPEVSEALEGKTFEIATLPLKVQLEQESLLAAIDQQIENGIVVQQVFFYKVKKPTEGSIPLLELVSCYVRKRSKESTHET